MPCKQTAGFAYQYATKFLYRISERFVKKRIKTLLCDKLFCDKTAELQYVAADFSKLFPKLFPKLIDELIPSHFQEKEKDVVSAIFNALTEPKSAKELASIASCSVRTIKEKYLDKMLQTGVIDMTIPDEPTSRNQRYRLMHEMNDPTA